MRVCVACLLWAGVPLVVHYFGFLTSCLYDLWCGLEKSPRSVSLIEWAYSCSTKFHKRAQGLQHEWRANDKGKEVCWCATRNGKDQQTKCGPVSLTMRETIRRLWRQCRCGSAPLSEENGFFGFRVATPQKLLCAVLLGWIWCCLLVVGALWRGTRRCTDNARPQHFHFPS